MPKALGTWLFANNPTNFSKFPNTLRELINPELIIAEFDPKTQKLIPQNILRASNPQKLIFFTYHPQKLIPH